jgi:hypothetical protein
MKTLLTALTCIAAFSGCALTPEQRVEHMTRTYGPACLKLGYTVDSDGHRACMMQMDASQQVEDARIAGIIMQTNANIQSAYQANKPRTCYNFGATISCY